MWDPGAGQRVWVFQHLGIESLLENADILDLERDWYFMILWLQHLLDSVSLSLFVPNESDFCSYKSILMYSFIKILINY